MKLYEQLLKLYNSPESYYYNYRFSVNPINSPSKSYQFIEEYFTKGAKERAFDKKYINEIKRNGKNFHTVSIYFLGILLQPLFDNKIETVLNKLNDNFANRMNYKFAYTWFLTSLYHDTAWIIEDKRNYDVFQNCSTRYLSDYVNKKFEIEYNLFQHKWINNKSIKYSEQLVYNYLHYSVSERKRIDHGILGGLLLFDRLNKNYIENWEEYCIGNPLIEHNNRISFDNFEYKGVSWKREHIDHFGYVSNAIISHNIWTSLDNELYRRYSLDELTEKKYNKLKIEDDPLIFLLALVDTIEPTKYFNMVNTKLVLESVSIDVDVELKIINIIVNDKILNYSDWFKKIKTLDKWLNIDIKQYKNQMTINLNVL